MLHSGGKKLYEGATNCSGYGKHVEIVLAQYVEKGDVPPVHLL